MPKAKRMASDPLHWPIWHKLRTPYSKDMRKHSRMQRTLLGEGWNSVEDIDGGYQPIVANAALHITKP